MINAGEISVHVTIDKEQVQEAARLAARLFRSEYASAIIAGDVDEDRVQVEDEPPHIGAQVTNARGVIAERFEEGWRWRHLSTSGGWCWGSHFDWDIIADYSPLHLTTDEERRAVDLPVKGAEIKTANVISHAAAAHRAECHSGGRDESCMECVDPHAALATLRAYLNTTKRMFREAQEAWHKERSELQEALDVLTKRQSDDQSEIERLTHLLGSHADGHRCTCEMTDPGVYHGDNMHPPEWEQDPWCPTHPDMNVVTAEVKRLAALAEKGEAWMVRYGALRADVEREGRGITSAITKAVCSRILARDDERGQTDE